MPLGRAGRWLARVRVPPCAPGRAAPSIAALLVALAAALAGLLGPLPARAQGVELATLSTSRSEGALTLEFAVRLSLTRAVEDALQRGVPVYFVAEATLYKDRWYWRDDRIARVSRSWRIAYQPLTNTWRVGIGGLNQTFPTLGEALASASRSAGWKLADLAQIDADNPRAYYVEFGYRLDTSQLPSPMQFGLTTAGQGEWNVGVTRTLRLE